MPHASNTMFAPATYKQLSAAALTADLQIGIARVDSTLRFLALTRDIAFSGPGIATATLSVGTAVGGTQLLGATNVLVGAAVGVANATLGSGASIIVAANTPIWVRLTVTGANTSVLTSGKCSIHWEQAAANEPARSAAGV